MIGVIVRFQYESEFDAETLRGIAEGATGKFEGMPGLRMKAFTLDEAGREATNFYIWDSEDAARALFTQETLEQISSLYGVPAKVTFVEIAALVEN
jgi:hypothetical protein